MQDHGISSVSAMEVTVLHKAIIIYFYVKELLTAKHS